MTSKPFTIADHYVGLRTTYKVFVSLKTGKKYLAQHFIYKSLLTFTLNVLGRKGRVDERRLRAKMSS